MSTQQQIFNTRPAMRSALRHWVISAGLPAIAAAALQANAQGETANTDDTARPLETVIVTASRIDSSLADMARSVSIVERDRIETIQPQSIAQVLAYEPNITIAGGPRAANQSVNIRGLTGNKVLQTVDGSRQSFDSGHRPTYFLDPELLQSVEAVRGPVSSLWGSGALGGVVAQNTLKPSQLLSEDRDVGGFVKTGYNDNNRQNTTTVAVAGRTERTEMLLSGYYRDSDDIVLGNGERLPGSASQNHGLLAKLDWHLAEDQTMSFNYRGAQLTGSVPANGEAQINDSSNFLLDRDQETHNTSVNYRYSPGNELIDLQALAYFNRVEIDEQRLEDGRADTTEQDVYGLNLSNLSDFGGVQLLYGLDTYREEFVADRGGFNRPTPPDARSTVWSAYAQAMVPLADSWRIDLGVRYDDFSTRADNLSEQRSDSATSPSAALTWTPTHWAMLSLRHDRAFRAPAAEELYSSGFHFCLFPGFCNRFEPNPDLAPEKAANTELLGRLNFSDIAGADELLVEAAVFENRVDDFIEQIVEGPFFGPAMDPGFTTWVNVDKATLKGYELSATWLRGATALRMAYGSTRGSDDNTGEDLTNVPADSLKADFSHGFWQRQLQAGLRVTYAADQDRTNSPGVVPGLVYDGYTVTDLYASWQPAALAGLRLDLTLNNVTDEFYSRAWDQLPQAGREAILSVRYSF